MGYPEIQIRDILAIRFTRPFPGPALPAQFPG